jgi:hypothetical protein
MIASRTFRIAAASLLALAGACSSDSTTPGGPAASLDQVFAEASLSSLASLSGFASPISPVRGGSVTGMPAPSECTFSAGSFACSDVTISDVTFSRKFTLFDDHDVVQSQFVSGATSRVQFESAAHGTVNPGTAASFTVDQVQAFVLSGLTTSKHLLNGTSTTRIDDNSGPGGTPTTTTAVIGFSNLELPREAGGYPGSGSMDLTLTTTTTDFPSPAHIQLAFNGTSKVAVTVSAGAFPAQHCTLDLASQAPGCI